MLRLKLSLLPDLVLVLCLFWTSVQSKANYCSLCENHTMCKYKGVGSNCANPGASGVSEQEKIEIVDAHNRHRKMVAKGLERLGSRGPQPKAANMLKISWDNDLAQVAQRWADQCQFQHDACREDVRFKVGQNIYWKWKYPRHTVNWTEAVTSWYSEVKLFNGRNVNSFQFNPGTGHYTQLVWHDTFLVGCGRKDYGPNKIYVCNYGPSGNWLGQPLYNVGEPCSKCPAGTTCQDGLCDYGSSGVSGSLANEAIPTPNPSNNPLSNLPAFPAYDPNGGNQAGDSGNEIDVGPTYFSELKRCMEDIRKRIQKLVDDLRRRGKLP